MKTLMLASGNSHKVHEFESMLQPLGIKVLSLKDLEQPMDIEETGSTFEENAIIKAEAIAKLLQIPVVADDSGLAVDALNGEPGIYSARYMGHDTSYTIKNKNIIERVKDADDRSCRFIAAIALAVPGQKTEVFVGKIEGTVAYDIAGKSGFGYDPIFFYPPYQKTLAELSDEEKNEVSHRGKALRQCMAWLEEHPL